ncbi:MAG: hypothetical protein WCC06_04560 [Candidatus Aminicenantales bacterium]
MRCKKAEKWILRSLDRELKKEQRLSLEGHLRRCSLCQQKLKDYQIMCTTLRREISAEPLPNFWERLQPKLRERERLEPLFVWKTWGLRVIPASVLLIVMFLGALFFLLPSKEKDMSQTEALLLRNANPVAETQRLFEEERLEDRNMIVIFTAGDEESSSRRYFP